MSQSLDRSKLRPATQDELRFVEAEIERFTRWFNIPTIPRYQFEGRPKDFSELDWVFYELGGDLWYRDNGLAFTCVWGNVLVRSFGFEWTMMHPPRDFRDYLLRHPEGYVLFPWIRLWEAVDNPGGTQFHKSAHAWLRILVDVESRSYLPVGWHPATDAIRGDRTDFPKRVTQQLEELLSSPEYLLTLGMWPYDWGAGADWPAIEGRLQLHLNEARRPG
ncbi:MAG TPA: hypothetical protein VM452_10545 [Caulifigura sp.]|nr:hypothetical protein [Caulifigura sp.]